MTEVGKCIICKRFVPIQLDLMGTPLKDYTYICFKCMPRDGVVVLCFEDGMRLDLTNDEALTVFNHIPSRRIVVLDKKSRDLIIEILQPGEEALDIKKLRDQISDAEGEIEGLQSEIVVLESQIEEWKEEIDGYKGLRLVKM